MNGAIKGGIVTSTAHPCQIKNMANQVAQALALNNVNVIIIPIANNAHWTLLVADKTTKNITVVDSLRGNAENASTLLNNLKRYDRTTFDQYTATVFSTELQIGTHTDRMTCGVHALVYALIIAQLNSLDETKKIILGLPESQITIRAMLTGSQERHQVFPSQLFGAYRKEIASIVHNSDENT